MVEPIPLDDQDIRILEVEGPTIVGHTCKVIRLTSPGVSFDQLFELVSERVGSVPELSRKLGSGPDGISWVPDEDFKLDRHLAPYATGSRLSDPELAAAAGALFSEKLDRGRPLWRIDVAEAEDGGTASSGGSTIPSPTGPPR